MIIVVLFVWTIASTAPGNSSGSLWLPDVMKAYPNAEDCILAQLEYEDFDGPVKPHPAYKQGILKTACRPVRID